MAVGPLGALGSLAASARATLARRDAAAPEPTRPGTVWVLSGGAALGAAQAGMVRVLLDAGIVPDAVVGVSAGASTPDEQIKGVIAAIEAMERP